MSDNEPLVPEPETTSPLTSPPESVPLVRQTWRDLLLYLVIGVGAFLLASTVVGALFPELNTTATFLIFLANFVTLGGTTYLLGVRRGKISWEGLGLRPLRWRWEWLLLAAVVAIVLLPVRGAIGLVVQLLLEGNFESLQARGDIITGGALEFGWQAFGLTLLGAGILVPISEELFFRGLLHTWFWQATPRVWLRVLASASLFGLAHADSIGVVAASFVIGVVNAIAYERTRSLFVPIVIHMTTNSAAVVMLYLLLALLEFFPSLL